MVFAEILGPGVPGRHPDPDTRRRPRVRPAVLATAVAAGAVLAAGCAASAGAHSPAGASNGAATGSVAPAPRVAIKSFAFNPSPLDARVGQTVTVTNQDDTTHTLTADDHSFDTGNLAGGASGRLTLTKAGTFTYHCAIHNFMTGVIHVTA